MTYRAVLSEPTVVFPQLPGSLEVGSGSSGPNDGSENHQGQSSDGLAAKRPRELDNSKNADPESGSKKKKKKRNKGETKSG
jgi:hypothetical protein